MNFKDLKHLLFKIALFFKGFNGLIETTAGLSLIFLGRNHVANIITNIFHKELSEDPFDIFINLLLNLTKDVNASIYAFISIYLLFHGIIKIVMVTALYKDKIWAFPIALFLLTLFLFYQIFRLTIHYSYFSLILLIIDIIAIWLIYEEYKRIKK